MLKEFLLRSGIKSQADYVEMGYGQVEPNHLSAQRNGQIYAQLPADSSIEVLEQGQFVKYDYAKGLVNFEGAGEWMLVYNEIKLYREHQLDCEFAMVKGNYQARVYSPLDGTKAAEELYGPTRFLQGRREKWDGEKFVDLDRIPVYENGEPKKDEDGNLVYTDFSVASEVHDYYEMNDINNPDITDDYRKRLFMKLRAVKHPEAMMKTGTTMVPRVYKTMPGDIFTTNTINATELAVQDVLTPKAEAKNSKDATVRGLLCPASDDDKKDPTAMLWQVVKVYTMPDHQKGVKIMRIR